ncbi:hypothetical protein QKW60_06920 [Defluviimonas aestuarii]|uniref:hypothetical protein n=1 Tax=Albidovulum aestuarii TaxID=1130726 RepID=UPI00249C64E2|nr:hypothetical protein [Defluviimonas aestuarii]MDI3336132.1 hypothetical protein [Defluviimonas aestuarii]
MSFLDAPPNAQAFVCLHVSRKEREANFVFHHVDRSYSLFCGYEDCDANNPANVQIVALGTMTSHDPAFRNLENLKAGFEAHRMENDQWDVMPIPEET